jgi:molybdopterin converting factor small subunit
MTNIQEQINEITFKIEEIDFEHGTTIVDIPDVVQVKYDENTNTSYVMYNNDKYDSLEDVIASNDEVGENYLCLLTAHYEELINDAN